LRLSYGSGADAGREEDMEHTVTAIITATGYLIRKIENRSVID